MCLHFELVSSLLLVMAPFSACSVSFQHVLQAHQLSLGQVTFKAATTIVVKRCMFHILTSLMVLLESLVGPPSVPNLKHSQACSCRQSSSDELAILFLSCSCSHENLWLELHPSQV